MNALRLLVLLCAMMAASAADPCLEDDYATKNYGTCCAQGGYKLEGHGDVCKRVGPIAKKKMEL